MIEMIEMIEVEISPDSINQSLHKSPHRAWKLLHFEPLTAQAKAVLESKLYCCETVCGSFFWNSLILFIPAHGSLLFGPRTRSFARLAGSPDPHLPLQSDSGHRRYVHFRNLRGE